VRTFLPIIALFWGLAPGILGTVRAGAAEISAHCAPEPKPASRSHSRRWAGANGSSGQQPGPRRHSTYAACRTVLSQDPFITSYARITEKIDFGGQRRLVKLHLTWPESDPGQLNPTRLW